MQGQHSQSHTHPPTLKQTPASLHRPLTIGHGLHPLNMGHELHEGNTLLRPAQHAINGHAPFMLGMPARAASYGVRYKRQARNSRNSWPLLRAAARPSHRAHAVDLGTPANGRKQKRESCGAPKTRGGYQWRRNGQR